ncbi:MAG: segregation/condensation protein A [Hyphomicrobiales bacterium]|nr:segregation/condensation protein A [Hyphomicrobiales bacterium]MBV8440912.1 segregation/condensation protein A [Hyphomicrobiales bacterium]
MSGADEFPGALGPGSVTGDEAFTVDLDGFEGPLDLLLELARRQKVDLARISVLALAEQYLLFIEAARKLRLELAADYLVMAAWLAYLKSRLLLPAPPRAAEPDASELADALARRLRTLETIRKAAELLMDRPRLGRDIFARGVPEAVEAPRRVVYEATLYDILAAYARQAQKHANAAVRLRTRSVWSLAEAREILARLIGRVCDWTAFDDWVLEACVDPKMRRSARASSFSASLELVREGKIELRQDAMFAPIWIRACPAAAVDEIAA